MTTTYFIDVSHHDRDRRGGPINWHEVWPDDTTPPGAMIAKQTEGDPSGPVFTIDPYGVQAVNDAWAAGGRACGGYHCLSRGDAASIARQVDAFRRRLDLCGANWAMADVEPFPELVSAGVVPRREDALRLNDRWYAVEDRTLAWYVPEWFWGRSVAQGGLGGMDLRPLRGPLIASRYPGGAGSPAAIYEALTAAQLVELWGAYGGRTPDVVQFTSTAVVAGKKPTDANAFRGAFAQLFKLLIGSNGDPDMFAIQMAGADTTWWLSDGFVRRPLFDSYAIRQPLQQAGVVFVGPVTPPAGMGTATYLTRVAGLPVADGTPSPTPPSDDLAAITAAAHQGARDGAVATLTAATVGVSFTPPAAG